MASSSARELFECFDDSEMMQKLTAKGPTIGAERMDSAISIQDTVKVGNGRMWRRKTSQSPPNGFVISPEELIKGPLAIAAPQELHHTPLPKDFNLHDIGTCTKPCDCYPAQIDMHVTDADDYFFAHLEGPVAMLLCPPYNTITLGAQDGRNGVSDFRTLRAVFERLGMADTGVTEEQLASSYATRKGYWFKIDLSDIFHTNVIIYSTCPIVNTRVDLRLGHMGDSLDRWTILQIQATWRQYLSEAPGVNRHAHELGSVYSIKTRNVITCPWDFFLGWGRVKPAISQDDIPYITTTQSTEIQAQFVQKVGDGLFELGSMINPNRFFMDVQVWENEGFLQDIDPTDISAIYNQPWEPNDEPLRDIWKAARDDAEPSTIQPLQRVVGALDPFQPVEAIKDMVHRFLQLSGKEYQLSDPPEVRDLVITQCVFQQCPLGDGCGLDDDWGCSHCEDCPHCVTVGDADFCTCNIQKIALGHCHFCYKVSRFKMKGAHTIVDWLEKTEEELDEQAEEGKAE